MLTIKHLTKQFGKKTLFRDLCLTVEGPAVLWAPSGWGKTTLLRILMGLEEPTSGIVQGVGRVAAVFQEDRLCPQLTAVQNVTLVLPGSAEQYKEQIIEDFQNIEPGYFVIPHLYDFAEYGVPEYRERVLIVGIRIDTGFKFEHPAPTHGNGEGLLPFVTVGEAFEGVENVPYNNEFLKVQERTKKIISLIPEGGNFTSIPKDSPYYVKGMISHVYRRIHRNEPSKTIIAAGGGGTWGYHYPENRPLTNRERARIQSFPDDFIFYGNTTEVRRQIGNAVPIDLVKASGKVFKEAIKAIKINRKKELGTQGGK